MTSTYAAHDNIWIAKACCSPPHQRLGDLTLMNNHQTSSCAHHFSIPLQIISDVEAFGTTTEAVIRNDSAVHWGGRGSSALCCGPSGERQLPSAKP